MIRHLPPYGGPDVGSPYVGGHVDTGWLVALLVLLMRHAARPRTATGPQGWRPQWRSPALEELDPRRVRGGLPRDEDPARRADLLASAGGAAPPWHPGPPPATPAGAPPAA